MTANPNKWGFRDNIWSMDNEEKKNFHVIIAGSRDFSNYSLLEEKCDYILSRKKETNKIVVISGTAQGADRLGERYARERGYEIMRMPADWDSHGKKAGYIRNCDMADRADALIAFWDGKSKGTHNMIDIAKRKGLIVRVVKYIYQVKMREIDKKIGQLKEQTAKYAIEHITGKGMHTGIAWLRDSFNEYYDAISTPGIKISEDATINHRQILAQKVAIDCIHALDKEQLQQLDKVMDEIANNTSENNNIRR